MPRNPSFCTMNGHAGAAFARAMWIIAMHPAPRTIIAILLFSAYLITG